MLFSNYERQVQWLKEGKIDIAWNTNVAFIRSRHCTNNGAEAILMRDTDVGFKSVFVAKRDTMRGLEDLKGKKFGLGSLDSAQAAIMPLFYLQKMDLNCKKFLLLCLVAHRWKVGVWGYFALIAMWANTAIQGEVNLMCWIK